MQTLFFCGHQIYKNIGCICNIYHSRLHPRVDISLSTTAPRRLVLYYARATARENLPATKIRGQSQRFTYDRFWCLSSFLSKSVNVISLPASLQQHPPSHHFDVFCLYDTPSDVMVLPPKQVSRSLHLPHRSDACFRSICSTSTREG